MIRSTTGRHGGFGRRGFDSAVDRLSVLAVAFAAGLWATDVFFRTTLLEHGLTATRIVFGEDVLITCAFLPLMPRIARELRQARGWSWIAVIVIAVGPQAVATVLFTQSLNIAFRAGVASETYLLQQFQPLLAVGLAWMLLGERRRPLYWPLAAVGLIAVYLVVFAQDPLRPLTDLQSGRMTAALLALGAASLWASGTVLGRYTLRELSFLTVTGVRFALALPVLLLLVVLKDGVGALSTYQFRDLPALAGLALLPGFVALLLYYRALRSTPASVATLAETAYPLVVTLLLALPAPYGFSQHLYPLQLVGSGLFVIAILGLNVTTPRGLVRTVPERRRGLNEAGVA